MFFFYFPDKSSLYIILKIYDACSKYIKGKTLSDPNLRFSIRCSHKRNFSAPDHGRHGIIVIFSNRRQLHLIYRSRKVSMSYVKQTVHTESKYEKCPTSWKVFIFWICIFFVLFSETETRNMKIFNLQKTKGKKNNLLSPTHVDIFSHLFKDCFKKSIIKW